MSLRGTALRSSLQFTSQIVKRIQSTLSIALDTEEDTTSCTPHISGVRPFEEIPGPRGIYSIPLVGSALQFRPFTNHTIQRFDERAEEWRKQYGSICRVRVPYNWEIYLFEPEDVQKVFRHDNKYPYRACLPLFHTYNKRRNRTPTMGERNGEDWWSLRSPAQRAIAKPKQIEKFIPKICDIADDFVDRYRSKQQITNLPYPCMEYATEGLGMLCFDARLGCLESDDLSSKSEIMTHVENYFSYFGEQLLKPVHVFKWLRTPGYNKFERASDFIMSTADVHLQKCKQNLKAGQTGNDVSLMRDILACPHMTEDKTMAILTDFFRGGIDSTANALTFLLYHLAKHPDKQEKVYKDITRHVSSTGHLQDWQLQDMSYLKACLKESFRLVYPVILGTQRVLEKDITLQGYNVPKGVTINFCISSMCKNEKYFPEPEAYLPERWLQGQGCRNPTHPFTYIPFGFGPRGCVGQRFAEREILICAAKMLKNFRLSLPDGLTDVPFVYTTFATPKNPFSIKLHPR